METKADNETWDAFQFTEVGQERISNCGQNYNLAHVQHSECDSLPLENLYKSCKEIVTVTESRGGIRFNSLDFGSDQTTYQSNNAGDSMNQYENCLKIVDEDSLIKHIGR